MDRDKRAFLIGAAGATGVLAGCGSFRGTDDGGTPASGSWELPDHPSLAGITGEPRRGPPPGEASGLVVAFEDPSCPTCRRFELGIYPELRSRLIEPGKATFVARTVPAVRQWAAAATRTLEATFARDGKAFWTLLMHYYEMQGEFTTGNVFERSERFLAGNTDLDALGVVTAARDGEHDDAVRADVRAAENVGLSGTPTFYLFARGEFRTEIAGAQSASVFENALGV